MISGKLKHRLSERCPKCRLTLQLRTFEENGKQIEMKVCPGETCDYEERVRSKTRRRLPEEGV